MDEESLVKGKEIIQARTGYRNRQFDQYEKQALWYRRYLMLGCVQHVERRAKREAGSAPAALSGRTAPSYRSMRSISGSGSIG